VKQATPPAAQWEGRPVAFWRERWHVPELLVFERAGSTNDIVRDLAATAAPAGTTVIADLQTAGRGRFGRRWEAPAASSLLLSCLLRPAVGSDVAPGTVPLRVGLAAAQAVQTITGLHAALKWPNDIVAPGGGKLGGVLCEAVTTGTSWCVVAGIGINVRQSEYDWPLALRGLATSLDAVTGARVDRAALAAALLDRLRPLFEAPATCLTRAELDAFADRDVLNGEEIVVIADEERAETPMCGVAAGIAPDGALVLRTAGGEERITSGTIRLADDHRQRTDPEYP
jgi:BirA family transcriptional regulator, biotin operon repressor / biotin---[acetyl-CoA-carboxylase] ligase